MPPQLIVMIGLGITYSVTGGSSLHNFYTIVCHKNGMGECHSAGLSVWIIVFSAIHLVIIQVTAYHPISLMLSFACALACVRPRACVFLCRASGHLSVHASCIPRACCPALAKVAHLENHNAEVLLNPCRRPTSTPCQECPWLLPSCHSPTQPLPLLAPSMWAGSQTLCTTSTATAKPTASLVYSMRLERWLLLTEATTSSWRFRWASVCASSQLTKTAAP